MSGFYPVIGGSYVIVSKGPKDTRFRITGGGGDRVYRSSDASVYVMRDQQDVDRLVDTVVTLNKENPGWTFRVRATRLTPKTLPGSQEDPDSFSGQELRDLAFGSDIVLFWSAIMASQVLQTPKKETGVTLYQIVNDKKVFEDFGAARISNVRGLRAFMVADELPVDILTPKSLASFIALTVSRADPGDVPHYIGISVETVSRGESESVFVTVTVYVNEQDFPASRAGEEVPLDEYEPSWVNGPALEVMD